MTESRSVLAALSQAAGETPACPALTASARHGTVRKGHGICIRISPFQSKLPRDFWLDETGSINASSKAIPVLTGIPTSTLDSHTNAMRDRDACSS